MPATPATAMTRSHATLVERLPTFPQLGPLGAFFSYNNAGFILLGRLIEVATGLTYRAAIQALVLDPLGMRASTFAPEEIDRQPHAVGHARGLQGTAVVTPLNLPRNLDPAGGLWSTTRDQLRYARFHLGVGTVGGGRRLLAPYTLGLMRTPQVTIPRNALAGDGAALVRPAPARPEAGHARWRYVRPAHGIRVRPGPRLRPRPPTNAEPAGGLAEVAVSTRRPSATSASAWSLREPALWRC